MSVPKGTVGDDCLHFFASSVLKSLYVMTPADLQP